jgi:hypothetical protein
LSVDAIVPEKHTVRTEVAMLRIGEINLQGWWKGRLRESRTRNETEMMPGRHRMGWTSWTVGKEEVSESTQRQNPEDHLPHQHENPKSHIYIYTVCKSSFPESKHEKTRISFTTNPQCRAYKKCN